MTKRQEQNSMCQGNGNVENLDQLKSCVLPSREFFSSIMFLSFISHSFSLLFLLAIANAIKEWQRQQRTGDFKEDEEEDIYAVNRIPINFYFPRTFFAIIRNFKLYISLCGRLNQMKMKCSHKPPQIRKKENLWLMFRYLLKKKLN